MAFAFLPSVATVDFAKISKMHCFEDLEHWILHMDLPYHPEQSPTWKKLSWFQNMPWNTKTWFFFRWLCFFPRKLICCIFNSISNLAVKWSWRVYHIKHKSHNNKTLPMPLNFAAADCCFRHLLEDVSIMTWIVTCQIVIISTFRKTDFRIQAAVPKPGFYFGFPVHKLFICMSHLCFLSFLLIFIV